MIIYIEKKALLYPQTKKLVSKFTSANIIEIDHYKNIFDKNTAGLNEQKALIIAKLESNAITQAPSWYGHTENAYFFKTSLNCIYDCSYCFLKWAFKTEHMVCFVNYDDIQDQIRKHISQLQSAKLHSDIWMYSSDYSDIQWMDGFSNFNNEFIPFFEQFSWVKMEIRTKSWNIQSLLDLGLIPKNTEVAFSLNPQDLIDRYETWTASLDMRIKAINTLIWAWWKVGIRLLPLLPVKNYKSIYSEFFTYLSHHIDMDTVYSSFASWLLFTKQDYNTILKKYPHLDILHYLSLEEDDFYRESKQVRNWFYNKIKSLDKKCLLCLEN